MVYWEFISYAFCEGNEGEWRIFTLPTFSPQLVTSEKKTTKKRFSDLAKVSINYKRVKCTGATFVG